MAYRCIGVAARIRRVFGSGDRPVTRLVWSDLEIYSELRGRRFPNRSRHSVAPPVRYHGK